MKAYSDLIVQRRNQKIKEEHERNIREAEAHAQENLRILKEKGRHSLFKRECTAEAVVYLDSLSLTDETILSGFTEDFTPESYSTTLCKDICPAYITSINVSRGGHEVQLFTVESLTNAVHDVVHTIVDSVYKERERIRTEKNKLRRIDETNQNIMNYLKESVDSHTFTKLTIDDWETISAKEVLGQTNERQWLHWGIDILKMGFVPRYSGLPSSFVSYYEEGKVPFCTKCPTCSIQTKLNYIRQRAGADDVPTNRFYEVYCDSHYFYDSNRNKHFMANPNGELYRNEERDKLWGINFYTVWNPSTHGTKWKEWDPTDPNGERAENERKKKEVEEIQRQIHEHLTRIDELNSKLSVVRASIHEETSNPIIMNTVNSPRGFRRHSIQQSGLS